MSNPVRKVLSVQGHSHLFSHRGGDTPECLQVTAVTACTELYGLEIPACVIPVPCVPSGLLTSRIEPWGVFLLLSSFLMWRFNIISAVSAAHGRHPCTKTVNLPHVCLDVHDDARSSRPINQSVASRLFYFLCGSHVSLWFWLSALNFTIYMHLLEFRQMFWICSYWLIRDYLRVPPLVAASHSPEGKAE